MLTIFSVGQGVGHPIIGLSTDRWGRFNVTAISTLLAGVTALLIWILAGKHFAGLIIYALCGALAGCLWPTVAAVGAEVVGLPLLPSGMSSPTILKFNQLTFSQLYQYFGCSYPFPHCLPSQ